MNTKQAYEEIDLHLQEDEKPSLYLNELWKTPIFKEYPFSMLYQLNFTEQSPLHHPEGNAWKHTMLVVNEAAKIKGKSKHARVLMWAALLHDIGKPSTTMLRKGRITSYDHDKEGEKLAKEFLTAVKAEEALIKQVAKLVRYHMQILFVVKNMPFAEVEQMNKETDIEEVALLGYCDRMGRTNADHKKEEETIRQFLQKCKRVNEKKR